MADPTTVASYPTALSVASSGPVRFFLNTAAQAAVEKAFAGLPADAKGASLDIQGDNGHVAAVVAVKVSKGVTLAAAWDRSVGTDGKPSSRYEGIVRWVF